ncbi:MAG: hypothetical protein RLZZ77_85 [Bacteroidota bacterium]|jgi:proteasome lid subunit RPN8/RPN11
MLSRFIFPFVLLISFSPLHSQVSLSRYGQLISSPFWLKINHLDGWAIHYTIDGSEPSEQSPVFPDSLYISSNLNPSELYSIPTSDSWRLALEMPSPDVVIRWVAIHPSYTLRPSGTENYLFKREHQWPILSINGNRENFFSLDSGIYVVGNNEVANFFRKGKRWERKMKVELRTSENEVLFHQTLGIRIHGRSSRTNPQKSLRLYAREEYGANEIDYPLFGASAPDQFEHLIVRAPEKIFSSAVIIDEVSQRMAVGLDINPQHSLPVEVRLNGEYWGIATLRERQDAEYIKDYFGYEEDEIDLVEWDRQAELEAGTIAHFSKWSSWLKSGSKNAESDVLALNEYIDVDHFIEYFCYQSIIANEDWPNNNLRLWRPLDGQWRFMYYDGDGSLQRHDRDPIQWVLEDARDDNPVSLIIQAFKDNPYFMQRLYFRMNLMLSGHMNTNKWTATFDEVADEFEPLIFDQINRWYNPESLASWYQAVEEARSFIGYRNLYLSQWLNDRLEIQLQLYPNPSNVISYVESDTEFGLSPVSLQLYNLQGQQVQTPYHILGPTQLSVETSSLPDGIYVLRTQIGVLSYHSRLIVTH